jgi:hypothetical protein
MFALSRSTRNLRLGVVAFLIVALPVAPIVGGSPGSVIAFAFVGSLALIAIAWLMHARVATHEVSAVRRAAGVDNVFRGSLDRSSYRMLRERIMQTGLFYQAAVRVWLAVPAGSLQLYCVGVPLSGAVQLLAEAPRSDTPTGSLPTGRALGFSAVDVGNLRIILSRRDAARVRKLLTR